MTARQKFWLKVVLTATLPAWFLPAILVGSVAMFGYGAWVLCGDMIDAITGPRE